ncbi:MAG TPA: SLBB domain-containing protein, partial [Phycisphaerae bacterium]
TVNPLTRRGASYTIFGFFGAALTANRGGPGTAFIPEPNFHLLEALATSGGLDERVQEVWIYRKKKSEPPASALPRPAANGANPSEQAGSLHHNLSGAMPSTSGVGAPGSSDPKRPGITSDAVAYADARREREAPAREGEAPAEPARREARPPSGLAARQIQDPPGREAGQPTTAPTGKRDETQELIEAVTGKTRQPAESPDESGMQPATEPQEPTSQFAPRRGPRFIYLRDQGIWVPVEEGPTPETEPGPELPPGMRPPTGAREGEAPIEPKVDWGAVAGGVEEYRLIVIPAGPLGKLDPRYNIIIRPGDTIRLKAEVEGIYYMTGQISRPGAFGIAAQKITLKAAVAAAGGLAPLGWPDRCTIYRRYGDREEMIQVNLDRIFAGRDPDFYVKPDDIINIGSHPAAVFLASARNAFRMFYGFGFVYDRNFADIDSFGSKVNPSAVNLRAQRFPGLFQNLNQ